MGRHVWLSTSTSRDENWCVVTWRDRRAQHSHIPGTLYVVVHEVLIVSCAFLVDGEFSVDLLGSLRSFFMTFHNFLHPSRSRFPKICPNQVIVLSSWKRSKRFVFFFNSLNILSYYSVHAYVCTCEKFDLTNSSFAMRFKLLHPCSFLIYFIALVSFYLYYFHFFFCSI